MLRELEYAQLTSLSVSGDVLDVGGSRNSGYQQLIKGDNEFYVINIDESCKPDEFVDIENKFPFEDCKFDHAICLNVLEHVFEFENVFTETLRVVKVNGKVVFAVPFMHHIHASPDDYLRYTESAYRRLAKKYNCDIETIAPLGHGFFCLVFQCIGESIPTTFLKLCFKKIAVHLDRFLNMISARYRKLSGRIPLGYYIIFIKQ